MLVMHPSFFYFQELEKFLSTIDSRKFSFYLVSENLMLRPKSCVVVG